MTVQARAVERREGGEPAAGGGFTTWVGRLRRSGGPRRAGRVNREPGPSHHHETGHRPAQG
jgi:hypothetical protein